jgi:MerE protein
MTVAAAIRRSGCRQMTTRNRAGAWLAILTCPCHGALLLYLLAGTTFGSVLLAYRTWMYAALAAAFVAGLWLMIRRDANACAIQGPASDDATARAGASRGRGDAAGSDGASGTVGAGL